ncbi:MAG: hypothetical protein NTX86_03865 [Candidatus Dependentiae bacterium]|nr:hypothetical protein [Candidatus Dependentiae bacterium]
MNKINLCLMFLLLSASYDIQGHNDTAPFDNQHTQNNSLNDSRHYYCTAADGDYFTMLMNLIGSIHKNDFDNLGTIAIFDLGLPPEARAHLCTIEKVIVCDVERKNPHILQYFRTNPDQLIKRGWFTWKPVVIKQALDMFPHILYLDAGTTVLQPLTDLFKHIRQHGSFFLNTGVPIEPRITKPVFEKVIAHMSPAEQDLCSDENTTSIDGGVQGLSHAVYDDYVLPMYNLASDLTVFMDDGSARIGFGEGRHDQTLASIFVNVLGYRMFHHGWNVLTIDGKRSPIHIHWSCRQINTFTSLFRSRNNIDIAHYETFIRYKK